MMALQQTYSNAYEDMPAPAAPAFSDADINAYVTQNINNPQAIAQAAQQYGVSAQDLSRATGYGLDAVNSYFQQANVTPYWQQQAPEVSPQQPTQAFVQEAPPEPIYEPFRPAQSTFVQEQVGQPTQQGVASLPPVTRTPDQIQQDIIDQERQRQSEAYYWKMRGLNDNVPAPVSTGIASLPGAQQAPVTPPITQPVAPPITQPVTPPATPAVPAPPPPPSRNDIIKDYVSNVLNNKDMTQFEKTNNIMEAAQKNNVSTKELQDLYGKDVVDKYLKDYGTEMKGYITSALGDTTKSDFDKVAMINQAANRYGLDANEIAQYSGLNKAGVDKIFNTFDTGLASIAKNLSAPTVSDLDKTKSVLGLQQKYGITDDQMAKAIGNGVTGKDVSNYLAPVKNFGNNLQAITSDNTKTAVDVQSFLDEAKKDPRIQGLYGLAIDKVQKAVPVLGLRDSIAGNGSPEQLAKGYTDFVAAVNADPALKEQYGAQADAIQKVADLSQRIADEKYGGKLQPHMFETFLGLDQKTIADVPKQLEMTKPQTKTAFDEDNRPYQYTVPAEIKDTKGLTPVYEGGGSDNDYQQLVGYTKPIKTAAGVTVDAQYDANGTLTGYRGRGEDKVWPAKRVGITGVWDADGKPHPQQTVERGGGFFKGLVQDFAEMGPIGQIALMAATGGLGSLAAGALEGALGGTLANAVGSGLVSGTMSELGGGKFGKGFVTGAIGNPVQGLAQNLVGQYMPNIDTGNATLNDYIGKALPNLASSEVGALLNGKDLTKTGLTSLLNTGTNIASNNLINSAMPDTLTPDMQKMFSGVSGQLLTGLLQGQTPDVQKAVMNTIMQNAMSQIKAPAKEKG
jgi:hypothetical protein